MMTSLPLERPTYPHFDLSHRILGAAVEVHRELGPGFREKVYENAFAVCLTESGISFVQQPPLMVSFRGQPVGNYFADFVVEGKIICELKALDDLIDIHEAQLFSYLKATKLEVGLLLNFGRKVIQVKRRVNQVP